MRIGRAVKADMIARAKETAETVAERIRYRTAAEHAHKEMLERFSPLTPEKCTKAFDWQAERIKELMHQYRGEGN